MNSKTTGISDDLCKVITDTSKECFPNIAFTLVKTYDRLCDVYEYMQSFFAKDYNIVTGNIDIITAIKSNVISSKTLQYYHQFSAYITSSLFTINCMSLNENPSSRMPLNDDSQCIDLDRFLDIVMRAKLDKVVKKVKGYMAHTPKKKWNISKLLDDIFISSSHISKKELYKLGVFLLDDYVECAVYFERFMYSLYEDLTSNYIKLLDRRLKESDPTIESIDYHLGNGCLSMTYDDFTTTFLATKKASNPTKYTSLIVNMVSNGALFIYHVPYKKVLLDKIKYLQDIIDNNPIEEDNAPKNIKDHTILKYLINTYTCIIDIYDIIYDAGVDTYNAIRLTEKGLRHNIHQFFCSFKRIVSLDNPIKQYNTMDIGRFNCMSCKVLMSYIPSYTNISIKHKDKEDKVLYTIGLNIFEKDLITTKDIQSRPIRHLFIKVNDLYIDQQRYNNKLPSPKNSIWSDKYPANCEWYHPICINDEPISKDPIYEIVEKVINNLFSDPNKYSNVPYLDDLITHYNIGSTNYTFHFYECRGYGYDGIIVDETLKTLYNWVLFSRNNTHILKRIEDKINQYYFDHVISKKLRKNIIRVEKKYSIRLRPRIFILDGNSDPLDTINCSCEELLEKDPKCKCIKYNNKEFYITKSIKYHTDNAHSYLDNRIYFSYLSQFDNFFNALNYISYGKYTMNSIYPICGFECFDKTTNTLISIEDILFSNKYDFITRKVAKQCMCEYIFFMQYYGRVNWEHQDIKNALKGYYGSIWNTKYLNASNGIFLRYIRKTINRIIEDAFPYEERRNIVNAIYNDWLRYDYEKYLSLVGNSSKIDNIEDLSTKISYFRENILLTDDIKNNKSTIDPICANYLLNV